MSRLRTPPKQIHAPGCPGRGCDCKWGKRPRLRDGSFLPWVFAPTQAECQQEVDRLLGIPPREQPDRQALVGEFGQRWVDAARKRNGRPWSRNCRIHYQATWRLHVAPAIGHLRVTQIRPSDITAWVAQMRAAGVGEPTIEKALTIARAMFTAWNADGHILPHGNPVLPGLADADRPPPWAPDDQQLRLWESAMYAELQCAFAVESFYGSRMGEVIALRETDITWVTGTGERRPGPPPPADPASWQPVPGPPLWPALSEIAWLAADQYDAAGVQIHWRRKMEADCTPGPTKNWRARRDLALPQWLAQRLADQFTAWPPADGWLFARRRAPQGRHGNGERRATLLPYEPTYYCRLVKQAARRAGIDAPRGKSTHALRDYVVTYLRRQGATWDDIGRWVGDEPRTLEAYYNVPDIDVPARMAALMDAPPAGDGRPARRLRAV